MQATIAPPELELASDLLMCGLTLRRLARSAPSLVRLTIGSRGAPPLFAEKAAMLDLLSFLATAEMALHSYADAELRRLRLPVTPGSTPWRTYIKRCDSTVTPPTSLPELRRLDLRLVEARNRLLAHRLRGHSLRVTIWRRTRRLQIALVPAMVSATADARLRTIAGGVGVPTTGSTGQVIAVLTQNAGALKGSQRKEIIELIREVGYETADPSSIVSDLLVVTGSLR